LSGSRLWSKGPSTTANEPCIVIMTGRQQTFSHLSLLGVSVIAARPTRFAPWFFKPSYASPFGRPNHCFFPVNPPYFPIRRSRMFCLRSKGSRSHRNAASGRHVGNEGDVCTNRLSPIGWDVQAHRKLAPFWLRRFTAKIAFLEEARWRFAAKVLWTAGHSSV
jgi:hypothetical protein